ncbi:FAD-dependent monooxygenase [Streptomyces sp. A1136]|uniref:FAD-dependent monooxygenase n=1 Tax=Streptomyces sp. A1136 TaxID=2563102 RepID=UPI0014487E8A|nr:FAD-dependent monooxygenase [Streptomyces sp. A1136]
MDVIVVGGGPVGLMTAALLNAAGVDVEVYERESAPVEQTRGSTVHPRTLEVLTMLETGDGRRISDVLVEQGQRLPRMHYATLPAQLDYSSLDTPFPFVLMVSQWRTEQALAEYLRYRGVPMHYGAEVTAVEQSVDEVAVRVGGGRRIAARYLVGADGAHSLVRKAAGIGFTGTLPDQVAFVADVELTEPIDAPRFFWRPEAGHANVVPMAGARARVFGIRAEDTGLTAEQVRRRQAEPFTLTELSDALNRICGDDCGVLSASWLSRTSNSSRHATTYRIGRVMIVGDAAHVHLPAGGQGLNTGLQDAGNLAWKLAAEVHGWAPDRLVVGEAAYDTERRPVAQRLVADTQAQDALMHTFSPAGASLRELFSGFIARDGEVAAQLSGWLSGLALAYPRPEGAHSLVGTRAPDLRLQHGSLFHALRPDRFLLLDLTVDLSLTDLRSGRLEVRHAPRPTGSGRAAWDGVQAVLIRPDGYVAHATSNLTGLTEAIAEWTEPSHLMPAARKPSCR